MTSRPLRVLWVGPRGALAAALPGAGVEVLPVENPGATSAWRERRQLRAQRPDVVHLEGPAAVRQHAVAAGLARVPVVWHLDEAWRPRRLPGMARPAVVVVDSRTALARLALPRTRVMPVVVLDPPETSFPSFGPMRLVGAVSSGTVSFGAHALLDAFAAAFGSPSRTRLVVAAPGLDPQEVRRLASLAAALGLGDRLQVEATLAAHLPRLDAFVHLPARPAGAPTTVLEAMAAGVPVVAARQGADAEVIEHGSTGLLVEPHDTADLTLALMRLDVDRGLRSRLAAAGLRRVADYSPARSGQAWCDLYREVAS